ncbi:MAG: hypothetical protein JST62_04065 [Bacteroidetes bacterium]|nr:hypothetical protein [Bacteroidota bacterium]
MKKYFSISLIIYTIIIGLLFFFFLIIKTYSNGDELNNERYYSTLIFLLLTFALIISYLTAKKNEYKINKVFGIASAVLIFVGIVFQIKLAFMLFNLSSISSIEDFIIILIYFLFVLLGINSIVELFLNLKG